MAEKQAAATPAAGTEEKVSKPVPLQKVPTKVKGVQLQKAPKKVKGARRSRKTKQAAVAAA